MIIRVSPGSVALDELQRFDRLCVVVAEGVIRSGAVGDMGHFAEDGDHAWLDPKGLCRAAGFDANSETQEGFDAMVAYAVSKGWVDDEGRLRAHVETFLR